MGDKQFTTTLFHVEDIHSLPATDYDLILQSEKAQEAAYAPYSQFAVGAALLLEDGTTVLGSNQENMAYPSGLCAERVAIFAAGAQHPGKSISSIAICCSLQQSGDVYFSPCGACRQALFEYEWKQKQPIRLFFHLRGRPDAWRIDSVASLMPFPFVL